VIGCRCATCSSTDPRDQRWRPSIVMTFDDGFTVLVDASTDLRAQALRFGLRRVDALLLTHSHADHIFGIDELRVFNYLQRGSIPCYASEPTWRDVRRMFRYIFDPATPSGGGLPQLEPFVIAGTFTLGRRMIVPVPLQHGAREILGFRVGTFAYLTDCNRIPERSWPLLEGVDVVVLDALRDTPHPTHFSLSEAVEAARRIGARRTLFTHMCHRLAHEETCARLPDGMALAYDGLRIDMDEADSPAVDDRDVTVTPLMLEADTGR
jgi:phosphoribosyl 1,2-cyclic phosphate phosphodiesterase